MVTTFFRIRAYALRRHGNEAAFTLVELLVVCLLISIMLAVSVPVLRDTLLTDHLKATTRKIIGTIKALREEAVREQQSFSLYFDIEQKRIWYEKDGEKDQEEQKAAMERGLHLPSSVRILDVWTKSDGRQSLGTATLWISRQGYMDMTVIHMTDDSDTISIVFSPFLGAIKVVDGYADLE